MAPAATPAATPAAPAPPAAPPPPAWRPQRQLLIYEPDGPVGGTFTCSACAAQAWQPDLLQHAPTCPYRPAPAA